MSCGRDGAPLPWISGTAGTTGSASDAATGSPSDAAQPQLRVPSEEELQELALLTLEGGPSLEQLVKQAAPHQMNGSVLQASNVAGLRHRAISMYSEKFSAYGYRDEWLADVVFFMDRLALSMHASSTFASPPSTVFPVTSAEVRRSRDAAASAMADDELWLACVLMALKMSEAESELDSAIQDLVIPLVQLRPPQTKCPKSRWNQVKKLEIFAMHKLDFRLAVPTSLQVVQHMAREICRSARVETLAAEWAGGKVVKLPVLVGPLLTKEKEEERRKNALPQRPLFRFEALAYCLHDLAVVHQPGKAYAHPAEALAAAALRLALCGWGPDPPEACRAKLTEQQEQLELSQKISEEHHYDLIACLYRLWSNPRPDCPVQRKWNARVPRNSPDGPLPAAPAKADLPPDIRDGCFFQTPQKTQKEPKVVLSATPGSRTARDPDQDATTPAKQLFASEGTTASPRSSLESPAQSSSPPSEVAAPANTPSPVTAAAAAASTHAQANAEASSPGELLQTAMDVVPNPAEATDCAPKQAEEAGAEQVALAEPAPGAIAEADTTVCPSPLFSSPAASLSQLQEADALLRPQAADEEVAPSTSEGRAGASEMKEEAACSSQRNAEDAGAVRRLGTAMVPYRAPSRPEVLPSMSTRHELPEFQAIVAKLTAPKPGSDRKRLLLSKPEPCGPKGSGPTEMREAREAGETNEVGKRQRTESPSAEKPKPDDQGSRMGGPSKLLNALQRGISQPRAAKEPPPKGRRKAEEAKTRIAELAHAQEFADEDDSEDAEDYPQEESSEYLPSEDERKRKPRKAKAAKAAPKKRPQYHPRNPFRAAPKSAAPARERSQRSKSNSKKEIGERQPCQAAQPQKGVLWHLQDMVATQRASAK